MVPVPNMKGSDLAYRIDGLIPPKTIELCGTPDKFFVSGILKLLFNKSFRDVAQYPYPAEAGCSTVAGRRRTRAAPAGITPAVSWS